MVQNNMQGDIDVCGDLEIWDRKELGRAEGQRYQGMTIEYGLG
jgi:hypothetical protein